ncbi:hypothetical protein BU26DRAFT_603668 [Trematosphaeria pertusa]|uniref:F-box domain-containing protein n=1 Tax=Trematosphaeria pertusa TaxID=390896 RepID=A0A6A6INQ3_9PLEO|nr:uncharacterized protein BU26DRAFT_603668 [Trematosphaeria pertusa]KAF2251210.1 hypothetical protein BU26DRAFT_603668 [Trematosphaeria pertusa]
MTARGMQRSNKRRHLSRERSPSKRTKRHANHDGSKGFDSLPDELILHIVHHALRSQNRVSTLTSFALTSRRPSRIVTPILYTTCNNSTGDSAKFLRTIINAPHLANMISDIHWVYGRQDDMKLLDSQLDHTERRELYHKLNDPGPSSTGTGSSVFAPSNIFVPRKSRDYLVAVMLLAPKLSFLDISDGLMQFPLAFYGLGCLRSLREMSEVRYMDVELKAFRRPMDETQGQYTTSLADHLPANIEHLDLFIEGKGGDSWMEGLEDLARSCRLRLSALKRLEVYHVLGTVQYSETDQKRLMDAFEEEGIKLEFRFVRDDDELGLWTR